MFGEAVRDGHVPRRVSELIDEEHALESDLALALEPYRLEHIAAHLDQSWGLLRERNTRGAPRDANGMGGSK